MKHFVKIMCFVLVMLLGFSVLGCNDCNDNEETEHSLTEKGSIVKDGQSTYTIIIPEEPTECEQYASEELQSFIAQSTGVWLPVKGENLIAYSAESNIISLGQTQILSELFPDLDYSSLNGDGFYIKNADESLFITGAIDRGTLYGVYELLEINLGIKFLASDYTYVPEAAEMKLYDYDIKEVPDFQYRGVLTRSVFRTDADQAFYARSRQTHDLISVDDKYGGQIAFCRSTPEMSHNTMAYVPVSKYLATEEQKVSNRDMYTYDMSGTPYDICWTNGITEDGTIDQTKEVSTAKALVDSLKQFVTEEPDAEYFFIGQMDFKTCCTCASCQASTRQYAQSGTQIRMLNAVLREVQAWADTQPELNGKKIQVVTFSYLYSTDAPVVRDASTGEYVAVDESVVPDENMHIRLTPFNANWYYALSDPLQSATFREYLAQWGAICSKFMVWDYGADFSNFFRYLPTIQRIKKDLKAYQDIGVTYYMQQNAHTEYNTVLAVMDSYVINKMLWDTDRDPYALRREFISLYFGAGSDKALEAIEFADNYIFEAQVQTNGSFMWNEGTSAIYHKAPYLEHIYNLLEEGVAAVLQSSADAELKELYVKHFEQFELYPLYLMLINRQALYSDNQQMFRFVTDRFFEICDEYGVVDYAENTTIERLKLLYP